MCPFGNKQMNVPRPNRCVRTGIVGALTVLCVTCLVFNTAKAKDVPDFSGTWVWHLTHFEDPRWRLDDLLCYFCSVQAHEYLKARLAEPGRRPLTELEVEVMDFNQKYIYGLLTEAATAYKDGYDQANDPVLKCEPVGFLMQSDSILPMVIEQHPDRIVFRYEYWETTRTVYLDGRPPSSTAPTRLGHSVGWFDGKTLVVETTGFASNVYASLINGLRNSDKARAIERYTRSEDGSRLERELTIIDPLTLKRPLVTVHTWLLAPNEKLQDFKCDALSGVP